MDTFILEISLLIGHIRDQFFVDTTPDIGQVNRVCWQITLLPNSNGARVPRCVTPLQGPRSPEGNGRW